MQGPQSKPQLLAPGAHHRHMTLVMPTTQRATHEVARQPSASPTPRLPLNSELMLQGPKSKAQLLTFFWCPSTACDLVMATVQGLELYKRLPTNQGLHCIGSKKHPTAWCMYSHEARIALLAGADGGQWVQVSMNDSITHNTNFTNPAFSPVAPSLPLPPLSPFS